MNFFSSSQPKNQTRNSPNRKRKTDPNQKKPDLSEKKENGFTPLETSFRKQTEIQNTFQKEEVKKSTLEIQAQINTLNFLEEETETRTRNVERNITESEEKINQNTKALLELESSLKILTVYAFQNEIKIPTQNVRSQELNGQIEALTQNYEKVLQLNSNLETIRDLNRHALGVLMQKKSILDSKKRVILEHKRSLEIILNDIKHQKDMAIQKMEHFRKKLDVKQQLIDRLEYPIYQLSPSLSIHPIYPNQNENQNENHLENQNLILENSQMKIEENIQQQSQNKIKLQDPNLDFVLDNLKQDELQKENLQKEDLKQEILKNDLEKITPKNSNTINTQKRTSPKVSPKIIPTSKSFNKTNNGDKKTTAFKDPQPTHRVSPNRNYYYHPQQNDSEWQRQQLEIIKKRKLLKQKKIEKLLLIQQKKNQKKRYKTQKNKEHQSYYLSPLLCFGIYKYHPNFQQIFQFSISSPFVNHSLNPFSKLCNNDLISSCTFSDCQNFHLSRSLISNAVVFNNIKEFFQNKVPQEQLEEFDGLFKKNAQFEDPQFEADFLSSQILKIFPKFDSENILFGENPPTFQIDQYAIEMVDSLLQLKQDEDQISCVVEPLSEDEFFENALRNDFSIENYERYFQKLPVLYANLFEAVSRIPKNLNPEAHEDTSSLNDALVVLGNLLVENHDDCIVWFTFLKIFSQVGSQVQLRSLFENGLNQFPICGAILKLHADVQRIYCKKRDAYSLAVNNYIQYLVDFESSSNPISNDENEDQMNLQTNNEIQMEYSSNEENFETESPILNSDFNTNNILENEFQEEINDVKESPISLAKKSLSEPDLNLSNDNLLTDEMIISKLSEEPPVENIEIEALFMEDRQTMESNLTIFLLNILQLQADSHHANEALETLKEFWKVQASDSVIQNPSIIVSLAIINIHLLIFDIFSEQEQEKYKISILQNAFALDYEDPYFNFSNIPSSRFSVQVTNNLNNFFEQIRTAIFPQLPSDYHIPILSYYFQIQFIVNAKDKDKLIQELFTLIDSHQNSPQVFFFLKVLMRSLNLFDPTDLEIFHHFSTLFSTNQSIFHFITQEILFKISSLFFSGINFQKSQQMMNILSKFFGNYGRNSLQFKLEKEKEQEKEKEKKIQNQIDNIEFFIESSLKNFMISYYSNILFIPNSQQKYSINNINNNNNNINNNNNMNIEENNLDLNSKIANTSDPYLILNYITFILLCKDEYNIASIFNNICDLFELSLLKIIKINQRKMIYYKYLQFLSSFMITKNDPNFKNHQQGNEFYFLLYLNAEKESFFNKEFIKKNQIESKIINISEKAFLEFNIYQKIIPDFIPFPNSYNWQEFWKRIQEWEFFRMKKVPEYHFQEKIFSFLPIKSACKILEELIDVKKHEIFYSIKFSQFQNFIGNKFGGLKTLTIAVKNNPESVILWKEILNLVCHSENLIEIRKIFERALLYHPENYSLWKKFLEFETIHKDSDKIQKVIDTALLIGIPL
ncbi:acyl-coa-binding domain-containing protein [Anaeramoeba ignava]|uniref:Acyl-coa-binding domain-containing protein n=1 Tax=Anaeramoeba ignava TaxID=1746090 RepID=A0A9Q0LJM7_ANAIG|nr:acyl-coa-binding domain-containing protein [Anaeramoeba ignava]